jgi:hypothetical protein
MNSKIFGTIASVALSLAFQLPLHADAVTDWNEITLSTLASVNEARPSPSSRVLAIVHVAVFDAVNSIEHRFSPYAVNAQPVAGASPEAAAIAAAYTALLSLYPSQAQPLGEAYAKSLAAIRDGAPKEKGIAVGEFVANTIVMLRASDGSNTTATYDQPLAPGIWRPTPPAFAPAVWVAWGKVTPFTLLSGSQFRADPPPSIYSRRYARDLEEVKSLGAIDSTTRTPEQTEIALFWVENSQITWNHIAEIVAARHNRSLAENARLFALLNLAGADSVIASFNTKYTYNLWRPISAIQEGIAGGANPIAPDPTWTPLQPTPAHPDYTSLHVIYGASAATVLASFYCTDEIPFSLTTASLPGVVRSFHSLSQALEEMSVSRICVGYHTRIAVRVGARQGRAIGDWVCDRFLTEDRDEHPARRRWPIAW